METVTRVAESNPLNFFSISGLSRSVLYNLPEEFMKKFVVGALIALLSTTATFAETAAQRVKSAATVIEEIMASPDKGIPEEVLSSAKCVAVVPTLVKAAFVVGGNHGKGMATCRTANGWSAPAPFTLTGGSVGFQIGGQAIDLVMMIMNDRGMQSLLTSKFKLGADASAAAGPVGRHVEGSTDWKLRAEVLTYSRARGLFAGIDLNGNAIRQDNDSTGELYGRFIPFSTILTGAVATPAAGQPFVAEVTKAVDNANNASGSQPKSTVPVNPPPATPVSAPARNAAPATSSAPGSNTAQPFPPPPPSDNAPAAAPSPTPQGR